MLNTHSFLLNSLHPGDRIIICGRHGISQKKYYTKIRIAEDYAVIFEPITINGKKINIESENADIYNDTWELICTNVKIGMMRDSESDMHIAYILPNEKSLPDRNYEITHFKLNHHCVVRPQAFDPRTVQLYTKPARLLYVGKDTFILTAYDLFEIDYKIEVFYSDIEFRGKIKDIAYGSNGLKSYFCLVKAQTDDYSDLYMWLKSRKK